MYSQQLYSSSIEGDTKKKVSIKLSIKIFKGYC